MYGCNLKLRIHILCQDVPLVYVPLEIIMSKYYGESERLLGKVFSLANELSDGAIIFLDEVKAWSLLDHLLVSFLSFCLCFF